MIPLKRLLNEEATEEGQFTWNEEYRSSPTQSEIPTLAEKTWDGLWGDILSSDVPNNDILHADDDEDIGTSMHMVEEDIEQWAMQYLPPVIEAPSDLQNPLLEPLKSTSAGSSTNQLCYGMIYRAAVKVEGNMLEIDAKLKIILNNRIDSSCSFDVVMSVTNFVLQFPDGAVFGVLNDHAGKAFEELIRLPNIHFEAIGSVQVIRETIGRVTKASDAVVRVNINIYGPKESKLEVGRHLSSQKLYLQRPDTLRTGSVYENPHVLVFSDLEISTYENELALQSERAPKSDNVERLRETISKVYSSLTRGTNLDKIEGDFRLKSTLLPHQEEALGFMLQREDGPIPPDFRLWKPLEGDNEGWYQHSVTKARNRAFAAETGGGILADEMGMGKSLSTLALITKTLEKAARWAVEEKNDQDNHTSQKTCKATLVVVPSAILINEWFNEISLHLDGTLTTLRYHGPKRRELLLEHADIVLTTYHTIVSDYKDKSSPLHAMKWYRIVLDEAHIIRRQVTTFFRAVTDLKARSRWCLTGTPIQNKLEDVGSLFAFIRAHPFHSIAMFRRFVAIPFDESEERREVATKNLTLLLESLCLRRSRDLLHLPEPHHRTKTISFSPEEREQYEQTKHSMNRALRHRVGDSHSKSIFGMFQVQLQLRILCNHGTYQQPFSWARRSLQDEREDALCSLGGYGEVNCSVCRQSLPVLDSNNLYQKYPGRCAHIICTECLCQNEQVTGLALKSGKKCPICAATGVDTSETRPHAKIEERKDAYLRQQGHSSKILALISDIRENLGQTKSIVFSCWTNTLDLIEKHLQAEDIPFYRVDGESPPARRQKTLDKFSTSSEVPVLIMTTGTGAFGLNLTTANRVFIVEPQWNPSVENQAIARAIRMNQRNSVLVTRYMIEGSVEQEMRSQQKRKLMIAEIGNGDLD